MESRTLERRQVALRARVGRVVQRTPVRDIHTHLYDPAFKDLLLWGIDDLLTYHYLVAEALRHAEVPCERFWTMPKSEQADLVWKQLFLDHSPVSEACCGVVTTLNRLGIDLRRRDLKSIRRWYADQEPEAHLTRCLELASVDRVCMTNSPFDDLERATWEAGFDRDPRFVAALRVDPLLLEWPTAARRLSQWGYPVGREINPRTADGVRRFLADWTRRLDARYLMVSFPPDFDYPARTFTAQLLEKAVLPHCREHRQPLALMLGVKRGVNPGLRLAGDGMGRANLASLENLCAAYSDNRFLATVLARENQHELCVLARKFRNLHPFGCWWFVNVPSLIDETTRMRLELLGTSFTPQHSDARVLDQLIYKWDHSRRTLGGVLADRYAALSASGWEPGLAEIERDARELLGGAFERFCGLRP